MAGETFKLNFVTNGEGIVTIDEPIGFDSADFNLVQKDKGYGRDISFSGGDSEFEFYRMRNHYYERLMHYYETYGWESEVQLIIEINGIDNIIGDLDFQEADTNQLEHFKCKVIQQSSQALIKRRRELNVDLFSSEDIDGNVITPLSTENVLLKAKAIKSISKWETSEIYNGGISNSNLGSGNEWRFFNFSRQLIEYSVADSFVPFQAKSSIRNNFKLIESQNNLRDIEVVIDNTDVNISCDSDGGANGYVEYRLVVAWGLKGVLTFTNQIVLLSGSLDPGESIGITDSHLVSIPALERNESIWVYWEINARKVSILGTIEMFITGTSQNVTITGTSVSYNSVFPSIRLKDMVSQNILSISGLSTSFPFAEMNGEMYNQRVFNGNLSRNITDKPFYISLKDIEEWLPEINGDYEISDSVFFGKYEDFYTNNEIGVFTSVRFDDYKKTFNSRYALNEFNYKYKKFQSQKESEVENTFDVVHGDSQWSILNKSVENKKTAEIKFVRDSFYIDDQRSKALIINETTSTQDDDTVFIIDCLEAIEDSIFTETDFFQHVYDDETGYLKISNSGNFSFILLGIAVGESFEILSSDPNAGVYNIIEVSERFITLNSGFGTTNNDGDRNTRFKYIVSLGTAKYISWSDEGFNYIDEILTKENYANLRYTIKRNIKRFYNEYLATCNFFTNSEVKNLKYSNNPDLSMSYDGFQTVEGDPFTPTNPILSPYMHEITLVIDFLTYKDLENALRTDRGYIRTYDANGHVIRVYPQKMTYVNSAEVGELKIIGEEKYVKSVINITYSNTGFLVINDEYRTQTINYSYIEELFYIFDATDKLLYNPVFWHKISINGAFPTSKTQLIEWLSLIS